MSLLIDGIQKNLSFEIDELGCVEIEPHKIVKPKKFVSNGKRPERDWIANIKFTDNKFDKTFIDLINEDDKNYIPTNRLEKNAVYRVAHTYSHSYKYDITYDLCFIVREKTADKLFIEFFQTELKAHKQLAKENRS